MCATGSFKERTGVRSKNIQGYASSHLTLSTRYSHVDFFVSLVCVKRALFGQ